MREVYERAVAHKPPAADKVVFFKKKMSMYNVLINTNALFVLNL